MSIHIDESRVRYLHREQKNGLSFFFHHPPLPGHVVACQWRHQQVIIAERRLSVPCLIVRFGERREEIQSGGLINAGSA